MDGVRGAISQGPGKVIFSILIFILLVVFLYNFYQWLNGGDDYKDYILYNSVNTGLPAKSTTATTYGTENVPGIYSGGEFSVSTWIYVKDWSINNGRNKPILVLSGGGPPSTGYATLVLYLGQRLNKLGVRISYDEGDTPKTLTTSEMVKLVSGTSPYSDMSTDSTSKTGDIEEISLQKWVNITTVVAGRTLDVYIDGKLSRSTVLPGMYKVDSDSPSVVLGGPHGFGGVIGKTRVANFAYSPDQVYKNYLSGPFDNSLISTIWGYINPGAYDVTIKKTS
jgi:hypothetical protein